MFRDPLGIAIFDPDHSEEEDRFITVGFSGNGRLLMVGHTDRGETIRIINARELNRQSERHMKKKSKGEKDGVPRPEYNLRPLLKGGVQGKYADRFWEGTNLVLLDHDVAEAFPNDEAVNEALRLVIQLRKLPRTEKQGASEQSDPK